MENNKTFEEALTNLEQIVKEGIEAKLAMMPETARFKLANTVTKIVNKGANNLIAIVI